MQPSKVEYRKQQKGRVRGISYKGSSLCFGNFGIKAVECGRISSKHIETSRVLLTRILGKTGKLWIRVFTDKPITRKAAGVRMGSGKGEPEFWVCRVRAGMILFEVSGVDISAFTDVFNVISDKLPVKIKMVVDREFNNC